MLIYSLKRAIECDKFSEKDKILRNRNEYKICTNPWRNQLNGCSLLRHVFICIHVFEMVARISEIISTNIFNILPVISWNWISQWWKKSQSLFAYWYEPNGNSVHRYMSHCFDCRWHCMNYTVKFCWISYRYVTDDFPTLDIRCMRMNKFSSFSISCKYQKKETRHTAQFK